MSESTTYTIDAVEYNSIRGKEEEAKYKQQGKLFMLSRSDDGVLMIPVFGATMKRETVPTHNGLYQCSLMHYGDQANITQEVRFYSSRCGWLTGKDEVVVEFKNKGK